MAAGHGEMKFVLKGPELNLTCPFLSKKSQPVPCAICQKELMVVACFSS